MIKSSHRTSFGALFCVAISFIALSVLAIGLTVWGLRSDAIEDAYANTSNIAVVLSEQLMRSIQSVDIILTDVLEQVGSKSITDHNSFDSWIRSKEIRSFLIERLAQLSQADFIGLIDKDGHAATTTQELFALNTDVADRDYFQHFKNGNDNGVYISSLLKSRVSGAPTIFISRRISGANGEFLGVALIGLRLSYFESIYNSISRLGNQSFMLLRHDGAILIRYPDAMDRSKRMMRAESPWHKLVAEGGGHYRSPGTFDGTARFVAVQPLREYPLVVGIGISETAALGNWYRRTASIAAGTVLWLICSTFLVTLLSRQFRRLAEHKEKLRYLAHYDQLTKLPNRTRLQNDLNELITLRASADQSATSIALFDLDRFKDINDTLGHSTGDQLLQEVARRMSALAAGNARFYRLGGDEFVLVLPGCSDPCEIAQLADSMLNRLRESFDINGYQLFIGASCGIAIAADVSNVEELMSNADLALYDAKAAGGNVYRLFLPVLRAKAQARRELDIEFRRACSDNEFVLYFQPQVRVSDGLVVGAEALLRWRHPQRGILAPGAFIETLAESPVALELGRWIMQTACEAAARWRTMGLPSIRIGVNLFPAQFRETLLKDVEVALLQSGLPPEALELEITENIALDRDEKMAAQLRTLRGMGVGLALDDFGTGYASLSYLTRYPLTRIKIDQSFMRKITDKSNSQDTAIVRSLIIMAHNLGLQVIAEGVETPDQAAFLQTEKCEEAQGFLYAKPLPVQEFEKFLRSNHTHLHDFEKAHAKIALRMAT